MKAIVYRGKRDVEVEKVEDPKIEKEDDIVVKVTSTAICGSDLHLIHGMIPNMPSGFVLGHETMGIVEDSDIQQEIKEILDLYLKDNVKAKILQSDGSYKLNNIKENEKRVNAQEELVQFTHNKNKNLEKEFSQTIIIPMVK